MYNKCCDGRFHTIKKGDTLYSLARMYNIPLIMLLRANPFIDVYNMQIGEKVCIPIRCDLVCNEISASEGAPKTFAYVIMPGETLNDILVKYKISIEDIFEYNRPEDIVMKPGVAIMLPIEAMNEQGGTGQGTASFDGMTRRDFMRESVRSDNMAGENMMPNGMRDNMNGNMMPNGMRDNMNGNMMPNGMMRDNMMNGNMMPNDMNRNNTMTDDMIRDDMMQDEIMRSDMMREAR